MGHCKFLNSTGDMGNNKRQRHATLAFLKIDMRHQDLPSRAPLRLEKKALGLGNLNINCWEGQANSKTKRKKKDSETGSTILVFQFGFLVFHLKIIGYVYDAYFV